MGDRLYQAGARDLLAAYPALPALRAASQSRIERTVKARSPRIAAKVTTAVAAALAAQDVTVPAEAATGRVIAELAGDLTGSAPAAMPWRARSRRRSWPALPVS